MVRQDPGRSDRIRDVRLTPLHPASVGCYSTYMTNQEISRQDRILAGVAILMDSTQNLTKVATSLRVALNDDELYIAILDEFENL
jgi:hypothetical protein